MCPFRWPICTIDSQKSGLITVAVQREHDEINSSHRNRLKLIVFVVI